MTSMSTIQRLLDRWRPDDGAGAHRRAARAGARATSAGSSSGTARCTLPSSATTRRSRAWSRRSPARSSSRTIRRASAAGSRSAPACASASVFLVEARRRRRRSFDCCSSSRRRAALGVGAKLVARVHVVRARGRLPAHHAVDAEPPRRGAQALRQRGLSPRRRGAASKLRARPRRGDLAARS